MTVTFHLIVSPVDDRTGYPMPAGDAPSTLVERLVLGDEYLWVIASIDPLHQGLMEGAIVGFGEFISRADNEAFLTEDGARLIAFGHTDDEYETPFMIDLDPLLAVASWQTWLDEQRGSDVEKRRGLELGHAIVAARRARGQLPT